VDYPIDELFFLKKNLLLVLGKQNSCASLSLLVSSGVVFPVNRSRYNLLLSADENNNLLLSADENDAPLPVDEHDKKVVE